MIDKPPQTVPMKTFTWYLIAFGISVFLNCFQQGKIIIQQKRIAADDQIHYLTVPQSDLHYLVEGNFDYTCTKVTHKGEKK
jgi:hypothetical protein